MINTVCTWPTGKLEASKCQETGEWVVTTHNEGLADKSMILCAAHAQIGFDTARAFHGEKVADFVTFNEVGADPNARDIRIMRSEKRHTLDERREAHRRQDRRIT